MTKKRYISTSRRLTIMMLFSLIMTLSIFAQQRTVNGVVHDVLGEEIIGATVIVEGSTRGTVTNIEGKFSIAASPNETLRISYLGYKDVVLAASSTTLNVLLQEDTQTLEEVIIVGYGTRK